jgi:tRNA modification GTPase
VIRISGEKAIATAAKVFVPKSAKKVEEYKGNTAIYGSIFSEGKRIDDGILTLFRAPASYTGEDVAEISCHGGILLTSMVLEAILAAGARPAEAGEFTKRAFLSGKLTLTKAEAVMDLIDAESEEQVRLAASHLSGVLSAKIHALYEELRMLVSSAYVYADYPDEDLSDLSSEEMLQKLLFLQKELQHLLDSYQRGRAIKSGISTVLVGRPNTGKSSLLNRLLGRDRAIVSDIAGTTRDTVEESLYLGEIKINLIDTAGIRSSSDPIEKIGVKRSLDALQRSELILALFDGSSPQTEEDRAFQEQLSHFSQTKLAILTKSDLERRFDGDLSGFDAVLSLSSKTGEGIDALTKQIQAVFAAGKIDYDKTAVLTSARQAASVKKATDCIEQAITALQSGFTPDVAGLDLEQAMIELGQTDGRTVSSDIVDSIFHRFCVGK